MSESFNTNTFSALEPAGDVARLIADLYWWLLGAATFIWMIFIALQIYAVMVKPGPHDPKRTRFFVIGGGVLFPIVMISISIYFSLLPLPEMLNDPPEGTLTIRVNGAQWWWRVNYQIGDNQVELANEIWLPVNRPVLFKLKSEDVIHSFWVPALAGKIDMIPGRENSLSFTPTRIGEYMGVCAEFCGTSHALMRLHVKVVEENVFNEWLENQKRPVLASDDPSFHSGREAFVSQGCTACHSVRGVSSIGTIGPDLTHVGSRKLIGAGILINNVHSMNKWIGDADSIKPEVLMPPFKMISVERREIIAHWLESLK